MQQLQLNIFSKIWVNHLVASCYYSRRYCRQIWDASPFRSEFCALGRIICRELSSPERKVLAKQSLLCEEEVRYTTKGDDNSLFGWVVKLVLVWSPEALLDPLILPKAFHSSQKLFRKGLSVFHSGHHVHHHLGVSLETKKDISN